MKLLVSVSFVSPTIVTGNPVFINSTIEVAAPTIFSESLSLDFGTSVKIDAGVTLKVSGDLVLTNGATLSVYFGDGSGEAPIQVAGCVQLEGNLVINVDEIQEDREYIVIFIIMLCSFLVRLSKPTASMGNQIQSN